MTNQSDPSEIHLINVGFNISEPVHSEILKTSQEIRDKYSSDWWLDDRRYHLHLPLYLFPCSTENLPKVVKVAKDFVRQVKRFELEITDFFENGAGLGMLAFSLPPELYELHLQALKAFNPIRGTLQRSKNSDLAYLVSLPADDQEKIKRFGHLWVLERYRPHISIARIRDRETMSEVIKTYKTRFIGLKTSIDRFQVHEPVFGADDRTILLFDHKIDSR